MAPVLYMANFSPPVRSVLMTADAVGVKLEHKVIDFMKGGNLDPEFVKINPQHTIPTLVDGEIIIWDSHAINAYLVGKYAKNDSLYPKDLGKRAIVDQRLHFDSGTIFPLLRGTVRGLKMKFFTSVPNDTITLAHEACDFLEKFINGNNWVCGADLTIADFNLIASITSLELLIPIEPEKYPNITQWLERAKQLPYYSKNEEGLESLKQIMSFLMSPKP